jgi:hypothetical protein
MTTITARQPQQHTHLAEPAHYTILGKTRMYCIQQDCDGTHHVYCSCVH